MASKKYWQQINKNGFIDGDSFVIILLVALFTFLIYVVYMKVTVWGPAEAKAAEEAAKQVAIINEAKRVEVANKAAPKAEAAQKRFSAEFYGEFNGGFGNNVRQIFILKDGKTGIEYLAITGCGVSELRTETYTVKEGKNDVTKMRTVEE